MASRDNLQIDGIQEALADLNKLDPSYRRQVTKDITAAGQKTVAEARSMVQTFDNSKGNGAPLSGMKRGALISGRIWWYNDLAENGFKVKVGVRATKERYVNFARYTNGVKTHTEQVPFGSIPYKLMVIQQTNAGGAIFDHAGIRGESSAFIANLNKEEGPAPRVIDKAVENNKPQMQREVEVTIAKIEEKLNRSLKRRYR